MKIKLIVSIAVVIFFLQWQISSCSSTTKKVIAGEPAVKGFYFLQTDSLLQQLNLLDNAAANHKNINDLITRIQVAIFHHF